MIGRTQIQRRIVAAVSALLVVAGLVWIGSAWYGGVFIRAVYSGEMLPYLGKLMRIHASNNPAHQEVGFYIQLVQGAGRHLFAITTVFWVVVVLCVRWRPSVLQSFFSESGSPLTLAVFRIVVFALLLDAVDVPEIVAHARRTSEVFYPPPLMGWFFNHVPLGEGWVRAASRLMQGACLFAMVGCFTRSAAWIAGGLGVYVLGIPELLGKINHGYHHVVWFALLLGAAPSGDALSIDALWHAWWHPEDGEAVRPSDSPRYGHALRWAWLLVAVIYFFAGFWKFMLSGMDWMIGENLKFKMYSNWHKLGFVPTLRIDRVPFLYQSLAVFVVAFELFFSVGILFRRTRPWTVLSGFSFHVGTAYFMRIFFTSLMWCYVMFVPWGTTLRRMGAIMFPTSLTVVWDPSSPLRRLVSVIRAFDWFDVIQYEVQGGVDGIEVRRDEKAWTGWAAFGRLLLRAPLLWPITPLLALGFAVSPALETRPMTASLSRGDTWRPVAVTGGVLLGMNVLFGLFLINSWPFSVYPTHAGTSGEYITDIKMVVTTVEGDTVAAESVLDFAPSRRRGLMRQVLSAPDSTTRMQKLRQATAMLSEQIPAALEAEEVRMYRAKISKVPEKWDENPVERSLMLTVPLHRSSAHTPETGSAHGEAPK